MRTFSAVLVFVRVTGSYTSHRASHAERRYDLWCHPEPWWRHQMETFSALLALCAGNSPVPVNSQHKGQWRGALMFSLIWVWINSWVNNREACDLRRYRAHCDVIVMRTAKQLVEWPVIENDMTLIWCHCNVIFQCEIIRKLNKNVKFCT